MSTSEDTVGVARDHRWMRLAEQQKQLKACSRVVMTLGDQAGRNGRGYRLDDIVRIIRPGTVVQLMYAFLLADHKTETSRLRRTAFDKALAAVEKRKGIVKDMLTGISTETPAKRMALKALAYDQIARSNQGKASAENGARSRGRPRRWGDPKDRQIIWDEWHSSAHATNTAAADEASRQMGKRISHYVMWKIVNDIREDRGLKGKGASGRRPNSAAAALSAVVGKPDPNRPLPKARVPKGVVYFIKNGAQSRVKIGFSESHKFRMSQLQGATPDKLTLLGTIPGTRKTESKMHARFADQRIWPRLEWFRVEGALARFLKALPKMAAER